jgi:uncharacterized membrane protein
MTRIRKNLRNFIVTAIFLLVGASILTIWIPASMAFRLVFGTVYLLFIPGFLLLWLTLPKINDGDDSLDWIERYTLSVGISIAVVPLIIYLSRRLLGISINAVSIFSEIGVFILILILFKAIYRIKHH